MDVSETESVPAVLSVSSGWRRAMCHGLPPGFVPMTLMFPPKSRRAFLIPAAFKISAAFSAAVPFAIPPRSRAHPFFRKYSPVSSLWEIYFMPVLPSASPRSVSVGT